MGFSVDEHRQIEISHKAVKMQRDSVSMCDVELQGSEISELFTLKVFWNQHCAASPKSPGLTKVAEIIPVFESFAMAEMDVLEAEIPM